MKFTTKVRPAVFFLVGATVILLLNAQPALAVTDAASRWRPTYDLVMKWLNFGIMVFVAIKFGKDPIRAFLHGRKESLAEKIQSFEEKNQILGARIQETQKALENSYARFEQIKKKIIVEGEKKKKKIIDQARQESEMMFRQTKLQIQNQILHARQQLLSELLEGAIDRAIEKLPREITLEDNRKLVNQYLDTLAAI